MQKQFLTFIRSVITGLMLLTSLGSQATVVRYDALPEPGLIAPNLAHQQLSGANKASLNSSLGLLDFLISPALQISNGASWTTAASQERVTAQAEARLEGHANSRDEYHGYTVREQSAAPISSAFILLLLSFMVWFLARAKRLNTK